MADEFKFDVFLNRCSKDKPIIRLIVESLLSFLLRDQLSTDYHSPHMHLDNSFSKNLQSQSLQVIDALLAPQESAALPAFSSRTHHSQSNIWVLS